MALYTWNQPTRQTNLLPGVGNTDAVTVAQLNATVGTPGGANTNIQFNNANTFGGSANLTFNSATNNLTVGGNVVSSGVSTTGNISGNYLLGNGALLTGVVTTASAYGNSNVGLLLGNLYDPINSFANITTFANISGQYILGNGALLTGLPVQYGNSNVATYLASGTDTANIITTANVSGQYILGNGAFLSGIAASYGNSNVATYLPTYTGNLVSLTGNVTTTANVQGGYILGNGAFLTGIQTAYGNSNVAAYLASGTNSSNIITTGNIVATNNISINGSGELYISTNNDNGGLGWTGIMTMTNTNANTTNPNKFVRLSSVGNLEIVNSGYSALLFQLTDAGNLSILGNVAAPYFLGNGRYLTGTYGNTEVAAYLASGADTSNIVTTGSITSNTFSSTSSTLVIDPGADASPLTGNVSVLGNLTVTGNINYNNVDSSYTSNLLWIAASTATNPTLASGGGLAVGNTSAPYATFTYNSVANTWNTNLPLVVNGNVTGSYFLGNGRFLTGGYGNSDVAAYLPSYTGGLPALTGNVTTTANVSSGNLVTTGSVTAGSITTNGTSGNIAGVNYYLGNAVTVSGNVTGSYILGNGAFLTGLPATYGNSNVAAYLASGTDTSAIITTGNISGAYISGNGSQLTGMYSNANVGFLLSSGVFTSNVITSSNVSASYYTGNGRFLSGMYSNTDVNAYLSGGSYVGNITTTGNVNGSYIYGNGAYLTGLPASYGNSNVAAYLASGTNTSNIVTTGTVTSGNISVGNIAATGNISAANILASGFKYANGANVTFDQPVTVTSNISVIDVSAPILVASSYGNTTYPGGVFTIYQPTGTVVSAASQWALGGTSKDAYTSFQLGIVNTQNISLTLSAINGTFNVQSSDNIIIGNTTITGSTLTALGITGSGGTYTITSGTVAANVQIDASTAISVNLTTTTGKKNAVSNPLTTIAPVLFNVGSLTASWANSNVVVGSATQTFSWSAGNITGTITGGNVNLTGSSTQTLTSSGATSGTSSAIVSNTGPYTLNATYTGAGTNGAGTRTVTVPYTLAPATDISPLFYKITGSSANPNFTTSDSHYSIPFVVPNAPQGTSMPAGAQGMTTSSTPADYNWFAIPGGAGTWNWSDTVPASGNVNIYAMYDQGTFYQIYTGEPTEINLGAIYYTTLGGVPYTVVGWSGWNAPFFLYLAKIT